MNILVVDDTETNRELLHATLEAEGHHVLEAANGLDALAVLECEPVDAIISDILMPKMDGYQLCHELRQNPHFQHIAFIHYTSTYTSPADRQLSETIGADQYLTKPVATQVLLDAVAEALRRSSERKGSEPNRSDPLCVMQEYNAVLVRKLEEHNAELEEAQKALTNFNQDLEKKVQERTAEHEATKRSLESFAYTVSHDLRAPLRHITAFAGFVLDEPGNTLTCQSREHLTVAAGAAVKMDRMIEGLLRLAGLGQAGLQLAIVDLSRLVEETRRELDPNNRKIQWRIGPLPKVVADPTLLPQVLTNLLSNAIKFSRNRPVARIEVGSLPGESGEVEVFIRDNGVGFDSQYAKELFGLFQRVHSEKEFEGTGIGLATVQAIIERHGGKVWAEGVIGRGATFHFTLKRGSTESR